MIPKFHGAKLTDIPDEDLLEILVRSGKKKKEKSYEKKREEGEVVWARLYR